MVIQQHDRAPSLGPSEHCFSVEDPKISLFEEEGAMSSSGGERILPQRLEHRVDVRHRERVLGGKKLFPIARRIFTCWIRQRFEEGFPHSEVTGISIGFKWNKMEELAGARGSSCCRITYSSAEILVQEVPL